VRFSDAQSIQNLQDTIIRVSHMLELNLSIFEGVLASPGLLEEAELHQNMPCSIKSMLSSISTLFAQTKRCKGHSESLLRRLDGSSVLVSLFILLVKYQSNMKLSRSGAFSMQKH
jgi:hypothetical protein